MNWQFPYRDTQTNADNTDLNGGPNPKRARAGNGLPNTGGNGSNVGGLGTISIPAFGGTSISVKPIVIWDKNGDAVTCYGAEFPTGVTWASLNALQAQWLRSWFAKAGVDGITDAHL